MVEFLRAKDDRFFGDFTLAQLVSLALVALGSFILFRWKEQAAFRLPREATILAPARQK